MPSFFRALFDTEVLLQAGCRGVPARWLWLHVVSDLLISLSYFAIPVALLRVMMQRKDRVYRIIAGLFCSFIAACGATHLMAVWSVWVHMDRLEGAFKALTAVLSVVTAVVMIRLVHYLSGIPSGADMEEAIHKRTAVLEAMHEKDERFRAFVEGVEDYAIYMLDPEGIVQSWNQGAQRMKGYAAEEIIGRSFSNFYTEEDQAAGKHLETMKIARETGRYQGEVLRVRKDGTRFLASVVMRPVSNALGELSGFSKVTRDLTETMEMEARYRMLLEAAPDAIVIVNVQGEIDFINAQAERMFGYQREELKGKPVDFLVPPRARSAQGNYLEQLFEGAEHPALDAPPETFGMRRDGSDFALEFSVSPLDTKEGRVMLFAVRDLTEKRRLEARFRALLNSAPDAMVISGPNGLIELTNLQAERLFGYATEEMVGQPVTMLIPPELREGYSEDSREFLQGDYRRRMGAGLELRARKKDGSEVPVEISFSPLEGPSGVSMTAAIRDVTERVAAQRHLAEKMEELRNSNEALEQFAHIASHDLQEPLRMVASYVQLLSKRYKGKLDSDADEFIGFAVDGAQRMKRLIEDLLVYSRAGRGPKSDQLVDSGEALNESLRNLRASIEESRAEVTFDRLPILATGETQLVQLFQNLVGNAIKYRGERLPRIHISVEREEGPDGDEWVFSVADNGIGIEPQYFERVFVIFQRLHGRGEYEGTGIGLAICKRVLQQQGGRIWVESEPGKGSIFHFSLPLR